MIDIAIGLIGVALFCLCYFLSTINKADKQEAQIIIRKLEPKEGPFFCFDCKYYNTSTESMPCKACLIPSNPCAWEAK